MTIVQIKAKAPTSDGDAPAAGFLEWVPTRRRVVADAVVLPAPFRVRLVSGSGSIEVQPTSTDWAWRVRESLAGLPVTTKYVAVPDVGSVNYADLTSVDPDTLDPVAEPQAAWWVYVEQVGNQAVTGAATAQAAAAQAEDSAGSAGTSAVAAAAAAASVPVQVPPLVAQALASSPTLVDAATAAVDLEMQGRHVAETITGYSPEAAGGFAGENGRGTELLVDSSGRVLDSSLKLWGDRLETVKGFIPSNTSIVYSGFAGENNRATELIVDPSGNVPFEVLERWSGRMPAPTIPVSPYLYEAGPDILNVGDSLTASGTISAKLAELSGRTVRNMGVGGETSAGIAARMGVWPFMMSPAGMKIPASGSVDVTFSSAYDGLTAWPLLQGTGVREGDTLLWGTVAGVRVRLSIRVKDPAVAYPSHGAGDIYQLTRAVDGAEVTLTRPEPFLPEFGMARSGDIVVAWIGQNGPTDDMTFATFQAIEQWLTKGQTKFLFMTKPTGDNTGWTDFEKKMQDRWGRRYCNVRRFLIDEALGLMGLTPTATDLADIAAGRVPTQLRTDAVHHTIAAQQAIAQWLLYPRMKELRMI